MQPTLAEPTPATGPAATAASAARSRRPGKPGTQPVLKGSPWPTATLGLLYPYDKTVWPRACCRRCSSGRHATRTKASTSTSARRRSTTRGTSQHRRRRSSTPDPQTAWNAIAYSNTGDPVTSRSCSRRAATPAGRSPRLERRAGHAHGHRLLQLVRHEPRAQLLLHPRRRALRRGDARHQARGDRPGRSSRATTPSAACATRSAPTARASSRSTATTRVVDVRADNGDPETSMAPPGLPLRVGRPVPRRHVPLLELGRAAGREHAAAHPLRHPAGHGDQPSGLSGGPPGAHARAFSPDGTHVGFNYYGGPAGDQKTARSRRWTSTQATNTFSNFHASTRPAVGGPRSGHFRFTDQRRRLRARG